MESLFLELEGLLRQMQSDQNLKTERPASESLEEYYHKWMKALEATSEKYLIYMSNPDNKLHYPIYVKFQIYHLVQLLCKIKEEMAIKNPFRLKQKKKPKSNKDLLTNLFFQTHKGLEFIEQNFVKFVDEQYSAEHKFVQLSKYWIESKSQAFKDRLDDFIADDELKEAILKVYDDFLHKESNKLTLNQIIYLKQFMVDTFDVNDGSETESNLLKWCIIKNFNAKEIIEYLEWSFSNDIYVKQLPYEQLRLAKLHIKMVKQLPIHKYLVFNPGVDNVYDYLTSWLNQEIKIIKDDIENNIAEDLSNSFNYRIQSLITTSQMATFIHLLHEVEIIEIGNKQAFYEFIAKFINTKSKDGISPLTLKAKAKNLSTRDRDGLIYKFEKAIKHLQNL